MSEQPGTVAVIQRFVGNVFIAIGVLWIAVSGLCSVWLLGISLFENPGVSDFLSGLTTVVLVGGVSIGIGYVILIIGRALKP